jgi:HAD superfamily hydrolase (TIGR01509 family)
MDGHPIRALLFDLDGLLVDSEPIWFEVESGFLAGLGHVWAPEDAAACIGQGTPNTLRVWRERFGVDVDVERDTEAILGRVIARAHAMRLQPGARDLLDRGRDLRLPMAVASSSRRRLVDALLSATQVRRYFDAVVSGDDVDRGKPAPDVFVRAAELLAVPIAECLVLEDSLAGVLAARACGARVVAVPSSQHEPIRQLAWRVVGSLAEVVPIVERLGAGTSRASES